jgi:hypothetical protein
MYLSFTLPEKKSLSREKTYFAEKGARQRRVE